MRMWLCDPSILCKNHLLGEHGEIHKHRHNFIKKHRMAGRMGQIEPSAMLTRHDELAKEMTRRGYNHNSPYDQPDISHLPPMFVNREKSLTILLSRCECCRNRKEATSS